MAQVLMCDRCGAIGPADTFKTAIIGVPMSSMMGSSARKEDPMFISREVCTSCAFVIHNVIANNPGAEVARP